LIDKWNGHSVQDRFIPYVLAFAAEEGVKLLSGAVGWGLPISISGYNGKDYEYILTAKRGFEDIIAEIDRRQEEMKDKARSKAGPEYLHVGSRMMNWEGMKIVLQAVIRYAKSVCETGKDCCGELTKPIRSAGKSFCELRKPVNGFPQSLSAIYRNLSSSTIFCRSWSGLNLAAAPGHPVRTIIMVVV